MGDLVFQHLSGQMGEAVGSSFIGKMFGDSLMNNLGGAITKSVDNYIDENGEAVIRNIVRSEIAGLAETKVSVVANGIESSGYDIADGVVEAYRDFVHKKAYPLIEKFDIGAIAKESINAMDNAQLEDLVMATMKTELNAVINLGALIGLALGLINMLIYLL